LIGTIANLGNVGGWDSAVGLGGSGPKAVVDPQLHRMKIVLVHVNILVEVRRALLFEVEELVLGFHGPRAIKFILKATTDRVAKEGVFDDSGVECII
jgi:hypothetical protein